MKLAELVSTLSECEIDGLSDVDVSDIEYDSRRVKPGAAFVCISGDQVDGHDFAEEAVENGAVAVVAERVVAAGTGIARVTVQNSRKALAQLSSRFFGNPSAELKLVGVTGTTGKTTSAYLIRGILEAAGHRVSLVGTVENIVAGRPVDSKLTTPEALDINRWLRNAVDSGDTAAVMEVSSHAIDLFRVFGLEYDAVVFTNLSQDHLDYHGNLEDYFFVKKRLFDEHNGVLNVVNIDDSYGRRLHGSGTGPSLAFGMGAEADVRGDQVRAGRNCLEFNLLARGESVKVAAQVGGLFNVANMLAAAAVAVGLGVDLATVRLGLESFSGVPGRFEHVSAGQNFEVVIDFAHTPDSLAKALEAARALEPTRVICVFGCGGDRDEDKRAVMGRVSARLADVTILTSDNPRSEDPQKIISDIETGVRTSESSWLRIADRRDAIMKAVDMAETGDLVLIAGKGHEDYQIFDHGVIPFDDREVAEELIRTKGARSGETRGGRRNTVT
ncbi:MAG: UDP-N-acetylmuramoyl-L-alanyl-D-glutamate--2,6-diaminopimelate ligase [Terriglobia bacterium]